MKKITFCPLSNFAKRNAFYKRSRVYRSKVIQVLLAGCMLTLTSVNAQEKYHFTFNTKQDNDTIIVYDAYNNPVLLYGKDVFTYQQTPIKIVEDKRKFVFSSPDKELGRVSSKRYKRIYLADSSTYVRKAGERELSYKKDGRVCANAEFTYNTYPLFVANSVNKVYVEMSVDSTDLYLTPFLFYGTLKHIKRMQRSEKIQQWALIPLYIWGVI